MGAQPADSTEEPKIMRFICALFVCGVLLPFLLAGCAVNPVTGRSELAFYQMSESQEMEIGRKVFPQAVQQMQGEYHDPRLQEYVQRVGMRLAAVSHRPHLPYEFKVVNDSSPNAFALPGGRIAITRGLLVDLQNESQLAAVLGHEIGHVTARHAAQGIQRGLLLELGMVILSQTAGDSSYGTVARQAGQLAGSLITSTYSREQERESDRLGIDYLAGARYNPQGAIELQEYFLKKSEGERQPLWLEGLFRTHPFSRERMLANEAYIRSVYPRAVKDPAYDTGRERFVEATRGLQATRKAYEAYDRAGKLEKAGDLAGALDLYRQARSAAPEQALLNFALGRALLQEKKYSDAGDYLQKAIRLDGGYYGSRLAYGYLLHQTGDNRGAIQQLKQSLELYPTLGGAFYLAEAYENGREFQKAFELYQQVAAADRNGELGKAADQRARSLALQYGIR
jgi:predicted Zn-dependent protease